MAAITSFIRFLINATLFLGAAVLLLMAASVYTNSGSYSNPRLLIETGPVRGRPSGNAAARALHPVLLAQVDSINTPLSSDSGLVPLTIDEGETAESVAQKLRDAGLIQDTQLFRQLLQYNGIDTQLVAGDYQLRRNMTMKEIAGALYRGRSAQMKVTVPAGMRMEQLADNLTAADIMDGRQFLRYAQRSMLIDHPLLAGRPPGQSLEGYLFPDAYLIADYATPQDLIMGMLNNMAGKLPPNALDLAQQQGLTFYEAITLASIVEREAVLAEERPIIASVFLNRLRSEIPLQADPTVQYAMGYQPGSEQWWKTPVSLDEYETVDSPYNTYLHSGLPPGPIASPGLASIMAVLYPAQTDYLFFVCRYPNCAAGEHVFAATYEEHLQNVAAYWESQ